MAGTFPAQYPSTYFAGWGKILPRNAWPKQGFVAVSNSQVTLTKNDVGEAIGGSSWDDNSYFIHEWAAGTKIWINNSSPACANNFCTIASVQNSKQLTIDESLTLAENQYRSAALAVIVQKTTGSGAVNLSAQLRIAKGYPHDIWTAGCAPNPVTSADGIVGYPCIFPHVRQDAGGLYFIGSSQPAIRLVSLFANPGYDSGYGGGRCALWNDHAARPVRTLLRPQRFHDYVYVGTHQWWLSGAIQNPIHGKLDRH